MSQRPPSYEVREDKPPSYEECIRLPSRSPLPEAPPPYIISGNVPINGLRNEANPPPLTIQTSSTQTLSTPLNVTSLEGYSTRSSEEVSHYFHYSFCL